MSGSDISFMRGSAGNDDALSKVTANLKLENIIAFDDWKSDDVGHIETTNEFSWADDVSEQDHEVIRQQEAAKERKKTKKLDKQVAMLEAKEQRGLVYQERERRGSMTPTLVRLLGPNFEEHDTELLVKRILQSISWSLLTNPSMIILGRPNGVRINYDPKATGITGIESRMNVLLASEPELSELDSLLLPLVASNPKAFNFKPLTAEDAGKYILSESAYGSRLSLGRKPLKFIRPMTLEKSGKIVNALVASYRGLCRKMDPNSLLLCDPDGLTQLFSEKRAKHAREWSLYSKEQGFASKLSECFQGPERTAEEYEDLVERVLYRFKKEWGSAIHGSDNPSTKLRKKKNVKVAGQASGEVVENGQGEEETQEDWW